jgi:hypothetical protein
MTKEIKLTQNQTTIVDDEDFEYLNQWKWWADYDSHTKSFRPARTCNGSTLFMHRVIMQTPKGLFVDHINHNTLDNRKENLRNVTNSQNQMNSKLLSTNTTGYRGVCPKDGKYVAKIRIGGKQVHLGYFKTPEEAYERYKDAAKEVHGEYSSITWEQVAK